ncbi:MAG: outer membrane lipoprotein-sorting protein [Acidobacteriota bacterium]|nr:outer membrane lipoprotein-sorting protein [Acidobacteriota bacterium]
MKRTKIILFALAILCFSAIGALAQNSNIVKKDLSQAEIDRIVKTFTSKEAEFRAALTNYVFNRSATIQTIGMGGQITGVYRRDSFMNLTPGGNRFEKILFAPMPTLTEISITPEDLEDLGGVNPFALEPSAVSQYNFNYVGKEKIDELNLYVFDVTPKVMPSPKSKLRLFTGRVWVDDGDLQIVKSKGKAVPEDKNNKYPIVETWRENIDGKYWFPAYISSDDELIFDSGQAVKLKMRVKYTDYRQGRSDVKILDEEAVPEDAPKPKPTPSPTPKKP